jgi:hypothetical protein
MQMAASPQSPRLLAVEGRCGQYKSTLQRSLVVCFLMLTVAGLCVYRMQVRLFA